MSKTWASINDALFHNPTVFMTVIAMQFMNSFVSSVFDPILLWLLPDRMFKSLDILLPDNDPSNDAVTVVQLATFLRKVVMLVLFVVAYHYIV